MVYNLLHFTEASKGTPGDAGGAFSLTVFASRKGPRANNCHGPRLALIRHCARHEIQ